MITGTTKSGFMYEIDDDVMDDYELLEMLCDVDNGNTSLITTAAKMLVGKEQMERLKEHNRGENGRVSVKKMIEDILDILHNEGKNSLPSPTC